MNIIIKLFVVLVVFCIVLVGFFAWYETKVPQVSAPTESDYKNLTYVIENTPVTLTDGYSETAATPGSDAKTITRYFGNETSGDLNKDGMADVAFLLTQQTGGSGTFYYLAAALKTNTGYTSANTIFLGDRISPQTTQINNGELLVNYADRKPSEPMTAAPSVGVSRYFKIESGILVEQMDKGEFGKEVALVVNQQVKFGDGLIVSLKEINDSRCKPGVVCVWAGELSVLLNVKGGEVGETAQAIRLATSTALKISKFGYTFELKGATETAATLVVTKQAGLTACSLEAKICADGSSVGRTGPNCEFTQCPSSSQGGCYIGGCSGQICSDQKDVDSTCEYKEEYACYKTATCARQTNGQCGWMQTPALAACLTTSN